MPLTSAHDRPTPTADDDPAAQPKSRRAVRDVLLLLPILVIAGALRFHALGRASLGTDELFSLWVSTGRGLDALPIDSAIDSPPNLTGYTGAPPWWHVIPAVRLETHPPLYFLLLRFWRECVGPSDAAARALSAVMSLAGVALLFDAVRLLHGRAAGLWAASLMALAGPQIELAQETRSYTMLVALVLACGAVVARVYTGGATRRRCVALGVLMMLAMLTHYHAAPALIAVAVAALVLLRDRRHDLRAVALTFVVAALAYALVWGPFLWRQRANFSNNMTWSLAAADRAGALATLGRALDLPMRYFFEPMQKSIPLARVAAVIYVLPLMLLWPRRSDDAAARQRRRPMLLWWLMLLLVVAAVAASDLARGGETLYQVRYTLVAAAATYALCAAAAMSSPRLGILRHAILAALALGCVAAIPKAYDQWKLDYRSMGKYIGRHARPNDALVILTGPKQFHAGELLYAAVTHYAARAPCRTLLILDRPADADQLRMLRNSEANVWVLAGPEQSIDQMLPGATVAESEPFPFVANAARVTFAGTEASPPPLSRPRQ